MEVWLCVLDSVNFGMDDGGEDRKSMAMVWIAIVLHMLNHMISGSMPMLYPEIMDE